MQMRIERLTVAATAIKSGTTLHVFVTENNKRRGFIVNVLDTPQKTNDGSLQVPFEIARGMPDTAGDGIGFAVQEDGTWNMIL